MKWKRGYKKGKSKKFLLVEVEIVEVMSVNIEESFSFDEENDNKVVIEVEFESVKVEKFINIRFDVLIERLFLIVVYGCVKVKLKMFKLLVFL